MSTIEDSSLFIGRLLAFYDSLFPRNGETPSVNFIAASPNNATTGKIEVLLAMHCGPIRQWIQGLIEERGVKVDITSGTKYSAGELCANILSLTIPNGSFTCIEVESSGEGKGEPVFIGGCSVDLANQFFIFLDIRWSGKLVSYGDISHFDQATRATLGTETTDIVA